jgi:hypothetical protein
MLIITQGKTAESIHLCQVAEDNACVSSQMATESNRRYQDLHTTAGNAVRMLLPPAPTGMTMVDCLHTVPSWVMEVAMYFIRLGATSAMAAT